METFIRWCDRLSKGCGVIAGILLIVAVILVLSEIVVRTLLDSTLYITEEYTGYLMAAITTLALAYTLQDKGHIRMVFLYSKLKGKARSALEIYSFAVGFVMFAVITFTTASFFWDSVVSQTRSMQISETYLAIPQFFMPFGALVITLQFAAELCRVINGLRLGVVKEQDIESGALGR